MNRAFETRLNELLVKEGLVKECYSYQRLRTSARRLLVTIVALE